MIPDKRTIMATSDPDHKVKPQNIATDTGRYAHCLAFGTAMLSAPDGGGPQFSIQMLDPDHPGYGLHCFLAPATMRILAETLLKSADFMERRATSEAAAAIPAARKMRP